jgi:phenylacetic acid degradation operon negative regulatory protein
MNTPDPVAIAIQQRLETLQAGGRLSAWSLIVSFLGDAIGPRGGEISAGTVQMVMARLGIGNGTVRTAISRLAADGWIERNREGRHSFYRLSPDVAETVRAAEQRIYAQAALLPADTPVWIILNTGPMADATCRHFKAQGGFALSDHTLLCFGPGKPDAAALPQQSVTIARLTSIEPGIDFLARIAEARLSAEVGAFQTAYSRIEAGLGPAPNGADRLDPLAAMALRCLMIHEWRRIALKLLWVPPGLMPPGDPEPETRALVARLYARLLAPSECWLDAHGSAASGALPPPAARLDERFGGL